MPRLSNYYIVGSPIDLTAQGYSARVFQVESNDEPGIDVAFKVLRAERIEDLDTWNSFKIEAELLDAFEELDEPAPIRMLDCGFIADRTQNDLNDCEIESFEKDVEKFKSMVPTFFQKHWRPYFALEYLPADLSLLNLIRGENNSGHIAGRRLTTESAINLMLQFCSFLKAAHENDFVYWDHKPEHAYWDEYNQELRIIDFNVSKIIERESASTKLMLKRQDLQHFALAIGYSIFTGADHRFRGFAPTATPSHRLNVDRRFEGISELDFDETLSTDLAGLINQLVNLGVPYTIDDLIRELQNCAIKQGWEFDDNPTKPTEEAKRNRKIILEGLEALRESQRLAKKARAAFLRASGKDVEAKRLYATTDMYIKHRPIP